MNAKLEMGQAPNVGIVHPGAMGISVAATLQNSGCVVYWVSEGRSAQSRERAEKYGLQDVGSMAALCQQVDVIVSVCPPHVAEDVAREVVSHGFQGLLLDANAISPQKAQRIEGLVTAVNITFVDGSIIGGPAWEPKRTWLYLSGAEAEGVQSYFAEGPLETAVVGTEIGQASALKMCFAAYTKGTSALLSMILSGADRLGVRQDLEQQWSRNGSDFAVQTQTRVRRVTAKAWRFEGEMHEIAETFDEIGLPAGFHLAAAEIYRRMASFKDAPELPELELVLQKIKAGEKK